MTQELVIAYQKRAQNIEANGPLGELLYIPELDGPPAEKWEPAPRLTFLPKSVKPWREYRMLDCDHCGEQKPHDLITDGDECGIIFCTSCGSGYNLPRIRPSQLAEVSIRQTRLERLEDAIYELSRQLSVFERLAAERGL